MKNYFSIFNNSEFQFLINDFNIQFDMCNLNCDYCLMEKNAKPGNDKSMSLVNIMSNYSNNDKFETIRKNLKDFTQIFKTPILRICGGELFYMKGILEFIESIHDNFEKVQIISNGYLLDASCIKRIKEMKNCILHISLDGHTHDLNIRRFKNKECHQKVLNNILDIINIEIPLEIASCLTDRNTGNYFKVADYFSSIGGNVILLPFPVRGKNCNQFQPLNDDKLKFKKLLYDYDLYKNILPPLAYIERLCNFYEFGNRNERCHIPKATVQTFHNGSIVSCCMDWSVEIGNISNSSRLDIENSFRENKIYDLYDMEPPRFPQCKSCFTISEIINLYIDNKITKKELKSMDLFSGNKTLSVINKIKNNIIKIDCEKRLINILNVIFKNRNIERDIKLCASLNELGLDSIGKLDFLIEIEKEFCLDFEETFWRSDISVTLDEIIDYIINKKLE